MSIFAILGIAVQTVEIAPGFLRRQDPLDRPISFMPPAGGTAALVRELADKSGLKLEADVSVHQDFMAIAAAGATPRVIMKQVASALGAEWKESGRSHSITANTGAGGGGAEAAGGHVGAEAH
jgi:hypothetical protein